MLQMSGYTSSRKKTYFQGLKKLQDRYRKCIDFLGEYVEYVWQLQLPSSIFSEKGSILISTRCSEDDEENFYSLGRRKQPNQKKHLVTYAFLVNAEL